ncbi:MAG: MarR family transcriptional regulator [Actinobacteria bacterium]|jgi:DNA-binding MarR family transcriptional regulator|nr:MAG: MarR family transcriptional regulator [Actinomycetota bacterium]
MAKKKDAELARYTQELWDTIMRIIHGFRTGIAADEDVELSFPQIILLMELQRSGTCSMGELSQRLHITQGVATRMVDRLLEKGMVERERGADDRRVVLVTPTKKGTCVAQDIERLNREKMVEIFQSVSEKERADLLALLKEIEKRFEKEGTP